jgi:hypothetical protein
MAPDRRALFEAAYGALMIRNAPAQPARRPVPPNGADQSPNTLPGSSLGDGVDPAARVRP